MAKIIVLGAGLVGSVMAKDLAKQHDVCSVDINQKALDTLSDKGIETICADISNKSTLHNLIIDCDIVVGAVPGFMGYEMMKNVIEAGKNIVDKATKTLNKAVDASAAITNNSIDKITTQ